MKLDRRTFLRGTAGAALALPLLERSLNDSGTAYADDSTLPKRFVSTHVGVSIAGGYDTSPLPLVPETTGFGYDVSSRTALSPLAEVRDEVTILSGLAIPCMRYNGGVVPRNGIGSLFHKNATRTLFRGIPSADPEDGTPEGADEPRIETWGESIDQIFAKRLGPSPIGHLCLSITKLHPHSTPSWKRDASGELVRVSTVNSPQQAWSSLSSAYVPDDAFEAGRLERLAMRRRSVLDLVAGQRQRLVQEVGVADRRRLERHFDEVRSLEQRLGALATSTMACTPVGDPGPDPVWQTGDSDATYAGNEELRAELMLDLIYMALSCDLARSVFLNFAHGGLWLEDIIGVQAGLHSLTHSGPEQTLRLGRVLEWQNRHLARFIARLRDTPEGDGNMLDNLVMSCTYEGSQGRGVEDDHLRSSHSTENMVAMLIGRAGGLQPGQHIATDGVHPSAVFVSAMRALCVEEGFGRFTTDDYVPELFGA